MPDSDPDLVARVEALARQVERLEQTVREQAAALNQLREVREERVAPRPAPAPERPAAPPAPPPRPRPSPPRPVPSFAHTAATARPEHRDLESLIGGNVLNKVGVLAVFLGAAYFLKLAYDNQWIGPLGRTAIGLLAGVGFILAGERVRGRGLRTQGEVLSGGGFGILYLSLFAAFQFWHLLPQFPAFLAMMVVTAAATVLAVRSNAPFLALVGALGGFLTPALLSTGVDNQVGLFSYVILLDLGLLVAVDRKQWMFLAYVAFGLTQITWLGWAAKFYGHDKWIATEMFQIALFALFALAAVRFSSAWLFTLNGLAFFAGSVLNLWDEPASFLAFLVVVNALACGLAVNEERSFLRPATFGLTVGVSVLWLDGPYDDSHRAKTLIAVGVIFASHFAALAHRLLRRRGVPRSDLGLIFGNAVFFYGTFYGLLRGDYAKLMGLLAVAVAVPHFLLGRVAYQRHSEARLPVFFLLGVALTFVTIAIPIQLEQHWITLAWAVEGVILTWIGFRAESPNTRRAATIVFGLTVMRLLVYEATVLTEGYTFLLNRRVFVWVADVSALLAAAYLYRQSTERIDASERPVPHAYALAAAFLLFLLGTFEISDYFSGRTASLEGEARAGLGYLERMSLSIFWASYAGILMAVGIVRNYRPIRWMSIGMFTLTVGKVFLIDLQELAQIYRVASFVVTGLLLIAASYLYQRVLGHAPASHEP